MTVPPALVKRLEGTVGAPLLIGYGQTEACGLVLPTTASDSPEDRATTLGRALPQVEARIIDPGTGFTAPTGIVGEICVRGYTVMSGYLDMPEATGEAIDSDGWLHTGDLGVMDGRGYVRIEGRLKEMIVRGGENIFPREVEDLLEQHPSVETAVVVGLPDPRYGEEVAAFVKLAQGATVGEAELSAYCREGLAAFKVPRRWLFVDEYPRTPLGKVQKFALSAMVQETA